MSLRVEIDRIIKERNRKADDLAARKKELSDLRTALKTAYGQMAAQSRQITDPELKQQYGQLVKSMELGVMERRIKKIENIMDDGIKRFSRDYISIGTIGREGNGKSQLLQSIGNIGNDIIPAYDAGSCTGAASAIWNDSSIPEGQVRVKITFRQPQELLDMVVPYLNTIDPNYLQDSPITFEEIGDIDLVNLALGIEDGQVSEATALRHLTKIVEHFEEIRDLFGQSTLFLSDPKEIKTFVAQNNGKSDDDPDCEYYYKYLAVARADIYCKFFADVGKICLVDTVGLGSTQHGIKDAMLDTVDKECDAAILVNKPVREIQIEDIEIYNNLRERFAKRETSRWLFYLINLHKGQTDNKVELTKNYVKNSKWAVADCQIIDASNKDSVRDDFMFPMVKTLARNMDAIDRDYLSAIDAQEAAIHKELQAFLDSLPDADTIDVSSMRGREAYQKGLRCFNTMSADLSRTVTEWYARRNENNTALWTRVQGILNHLDEVIPTAEEIQKISDSTGGMLADDIWNTMLHLVRNQITDRFIAIDDVLEKETLEFKNSLVRILYHELKALSETAQDNGQKVETDEDEDDVDMVKWLKDMMEGVLAEDPQYIQIRKAFSFLYDFSFNTRSEIIREVRRQMYIINPICEDEYAKPLENFKRSTCGNSIHFYLTSRMSVIEDELRYHLSRLYQTPNQAFYAAAEEFYDRLTFASDFKEGELVRMSDVWASFFQEFSEKLWESKAAHYQSVNDMIATYNQMIDMLEAYLRTHEH